MSVTLISRDQQPFLVTKESLRPSIILSTIVAPIDDTRVCSIPIYVADGVILDKVLQYCRYHCQDPIPENHDLYFSNCSFEAIYIDPWDQDFFSVDQETLFELIFVANALHIHRMAHLATFLAAKNSFAVTEKIINEFYHTKEYYSFLENEYNGERQLNEKLRSREEATTGTTDMDVDKDKVKVRGKSPLSL